MPASTPVYNIPYPCSGENIDCDIFADWAEAIQAAVSTTRTIQGRVLNRPAARASGSGQGGFALGVNTNMIYQTENYDNNGIVNLGSDNSAFTIQTAGWYLFGSWVDFPNNTSITSYALGFTRNGVVTYRRKSSSPALNQAARPGVQVLGVFVCVPGDIIRSTFLVTGATPATTRVTTFGYLVSQA